MLTVVTLHLSPGQRAARGFYEGMWLQWRDFQTVAYAPEEKSSCAKQRGGGSQALSHRHPECNQWSIGI